MNIIALSRRRGRYAIIFLLVSSPYVPKENLMINWIRRHYKRRRCSRGELIAINELILKAARRQNYDLAHLISYLGDGNDPVVLDQIRNEFYSLYHHYRSVFDPADFGKNYRTKLGQNLMEADLKIGQFKELCDKHGIDYSHIVANDIPF
ncbi:hypothetical protein AVT69_gp226 [Pseudomonas phage PhiPA3]|uniref:Uncharacterized protein 228 n=1 Tax=Pseudomonas phage PhiPA3 TaxID=998086 RepID=F8SJ71_BPPA3|nr:hypothetical protein AVT69_gp226 [Pseudomonas phage PhiPA3]AEH03651.1 hypothetical protein [Pseudomonas phage PhiPA3]